MLSKITSLSNEKLKSVKLLRERKVRETQSLTLVDGVKEIEAALDAKVRIAEVYFCPELIKTQQEHSLLVQMEKHNIPMFQLPKNAFMKIAYGERAQGLLAVIQSDNRSLKDFKYDGKSLLVVLEGVEKPGNLGAILRTCDAARVAGVIICDPQTDIFNPNVIRASVGTIFSVKTFIANNDEALEFLKQNKVKICAALTQAKHLYTKEDLSNRVAIVLGSEEKGLSDFWVKNSDAQIKIPMHGHIDSLNVSTSAAILIYEANRQKESK